MAICPLARCLLRRSTPLRPSWRWTVPRWGVLLGAVLDRCRRRRVGRVAEGEAHHLAVWVGNHARRGGSQVAVFGRGEAGVFGFAFFFCFFSAFGFFVFCFDAFAFGFVFFFAYLDRDVEGRAPALRRRAKASTVWRRRRRSRAEGAGRTRRIRGHGSVIGCRAAIPLVLGLRGGAGLRVSPLHCSAMHGSPPEIDGVTHRYVDVPGVRLHVAEAGEGPPILLLHGWPQHWWVWRKVIPALAENHRVICPDLRGFGWSEAPAGPLRNLRTRGRRRCPARRAGARPGRSDRP